MGFFVLSNLLIINIMRKNILILLLITTPFIRINAQTNVVINVLDKTKGKTELYFQDWTVIRTVGFAESKNIGEIEITSDSTCIFVIETSGLPNIVIAGLFKGREQKQILITPGDTISAVINFIDNDENRYEVVFYGKNEENYNKYYELKKEFDRNAIMKMAESVESLEKYLQVIDSAYISNTKKINATLRPSVLRNLMLNEEKARIFSYLAYRQRVFPDELTSSNFLNIKNRYFPDEKIVYENPLYMKSVEYTYGIERLSYFLSMGIKAENQLMAETDTIEKYFAGELKDYLLVTNFRSSSNRYKRNKELNEDDVDKWYNDYSKKVEGDIYKKFIQYSYEIYKILNNPFPEHILKEKIIQLSDSSVYTMGSFIEKHKGMQLVIDNWATWCGPCLREMRVGKESVKKLKELGNCFIYISIDEIRDFNKVKDKAIELGIIENAYLIPGGFKSEYASFLSISAIPRYIMIDVDGNVKNLRMPLPSNITNFSGFGK